MQVQGPNKKPKGESNLKSAKGLFSLSLGLWAVWASRPLIPMLGSKNHGRAPCSALLGGLASRTSRKGLTAWKGEPCGIKAGRRRV